jgi:hypothetical protein
MCYAPPMEISTTVTSKQTPKPRHVTPSTIPVGAVGQLESSAYAYAPNSRGPTYYIGLGGHRRIVFGPSIGRHGEVCDHLDSSPVRLLDPGESFTITVTA